MGLFSGGKKQNWLIVIHRWHVSSYGFHHELLPDATKKEAHAYATVTAKEHEGTCRNAAGIAIPLPDTVVVQNVGPSPSEFAKAVADEVEKRMVAKIDKIMEDGE